MREDYYKHQQMLISFPTITFVRSTHTVRSFCGQFHITCNVKSANCLCRHSYITYIKYITQSPAQETYKLTNQWPIPDICLVLNVVGHPTPSHFQFSYILPWNHCSQQRPYPGPPLSLPFALIFCPSRGRGFSVSCLSPHQFYLSKPSALLP